MNNKDSSERFVSADDKRESVMKSVKIEQAVDGESACEVIGVIAWFQLIDEPEALLSERER